MAGSTAVALIHTEAEGFTALDNRCPHQGGPLGEGQLDGPWLLCPWHGYEFDVTTGVCLFDRDAELDSYRVTVEDGEVILHVPQRSP